MINKLRSLYSKTSLSTQIISTIILVFITFFILQLLLNSVFFRNFYVNREIETFDALHQTYVRSMNDNTDDEYYDTMYAFIHNNNVYSVILERNFDISSSILTEYYVTIYDSIEDVAYDVLILDNHYTYKTDDHIDAVLSLSTDGIYSFREVSINGVTLLSRECLQACLSISGTVAAVSRPQNLNYLFEQNPLIQAEIRKIITNEIKLSDYSYLDGFRYSSEEGPLNSMVFIQPLGDWHYIMTVKPIQDTQNIIAVVSSYQNYVYLTAIAIIILWSFRIGTIASTPIKRIEHVARQIANLNFDVSADEFKNKETSSLSESINLISRNLHTTIETINNKNAQLITLYKEQTLQADLKKQLVSSISHELKTPLMIMQVTVQGILDNVIPSNEERHELENLLDEINKSSIMIQDLLQIYRLDDQDKALDYEPVNLGDLVKYCLEDFTNIFKKYEFNISQHIQDNALINADTQLIQRVISNFITNAVKYTPKGETIRVNVQILERSAVFEIINSGVSIPEEHLKNIWTPFFRLDVNTDDRLISRGSGVGLYLVGEILNAHHFDYGISNTADGVRAYFSAKIYNA